MHECTSLMSLTSLLGFGFCLTSARCQCWRSQAKSFFRCALSIWSATSWIWSASLSSHISLASLLHSALFLSSVCSLQVCQLMSSKVPCLVGLLLFSRSVGGVGLMANVITMRWLFCVGGRSGTAIMMPSLLSAVSEMFALLVSADLIRFWGRISVTSSAAVHLSPLNPY